jgi:hypothetical protein
VGLLITVRAFSLLFTNPDASRGGFDWVFWIDAIFAILGVLVGQLLVRRRNERRIQSS